VFTNHFHLKQPDAEQRLRAALEAGDNVDVLGLFFRYSGDHELTVGVPSSMPMRQMSSGSAFNDMTRAQTLLTVMEDEAWIAKLLGERQLELQLTDENGKIWWSTQRGNVAWPDGVALPIVTSTKWHA
jgi:hypothetical protein